MKSVKSDYELDEPVPASPVKYFSNNNVLKRTSSDSRLSSPRIKKIEKGKVIVLNSGPYASATTLDVNRANITRKPTLFGKFSRKVTDEELKRSIAAPSNFVHSLHLDKSDMIMNRLSPQHKEIIELANIDSSDLRDPETLKFILDFIVGQSNGTIGRRHKLRIHNEEERKLRIEQDLLIDSRNTENPDLVDQLVQQYSSMDELGSQSTMGSPKERNLLLDEIKSATAINLKPVSNRPTAGRNKMSGDIAHALSAALKVRKSKMKDESNSSLEAGEEDWNQ